MNDTYTALASFAQSWGLLYFAGTFFTIVVWVMWPSRKEKIEEASDIPLRED